MDAGLDGSMVTWMVAWAKPLHPTLHPTIQVTIQATMKFHSIENALISIIRRAFRFHAKLICPYCPKNKKLEV